ncbi:MAG: hypothetical protein Ct9H300mP25_13420 [Acidobacteriota bacterium]|nr:MAG: hypothetical protein Ct9H300mP25_13420 [Acidobacteriota bacterium]
MRVLSLVVSMMLVAGTAAAQQDPPPEATGDLAEVMGGFCSRIQTFFLMHKVMTLVRLQTKRMRTKAEHLLDLPGFIPAGSKLKMLLSHWLKQPI